MEAPEDQSPGVKINALGDGIPPQLPRENQKDLVPIGSSGRTMVQVASGINDSKDSLHSEDDKKKK